MQLAVKCVAALALMLSPCAWDTDPREAAAASALLAKAGVPTSPPKMMVSPAVTAAQKLQVKDH